VYGIKDKRATVIAKIPNDEVEREKKQSAQTGLLEENLSVQLAP
jgi:hypothetical protein